MLYFFLIIAAGMAATVITLILQLHRYLRAVDDATTYTICPNCHQSVQLTHFLCPCGQVNYLMPDSERVFYTRCKCGKLLPKTNKKGRSGFSAVCPKCRYILGKKAGVRREVLVPIVGGPASGKTAFLSAWVYTASGIPAKRSRYKFSFPFPGDSKFVRESIRLWSRGEIPEKTKIVIPKGFGMDMTALGPIKREYRVYCYDPAGEFFDEAKRMANFSYYEYMDGVIFLIDPFSISSVRQKYAQSIEQCRSQGFEVANRDLNDYCDRFLNSLKDYHGLGYDEYHYAVCAVVITKADVFDLDSSIGDKRVEAIRKKNPLLSFDEALNLACLRFLKQNGMGDVIEKLNDHFQKVQCFSVSAFGHMPEMNRAFHPIRVENPFLWIINETIKQDRQEKRRH